MSEVMMQELKQKPAKADFHACQENSPHYSIITEKTSIRGERVGSQKQSAAT